jgi:hypothetical protein
MATPCPSPGCATPEPSPATTQQTATEQPKKQPIKNIAKKAGKAARTIAEKAGPRKAHADPCQGANC